MPAALSAQPMSLVHAWPAVAVVGFLVHLPLPSAWVWQKYTPLQSVSDCEGPKPGMSQVAPGAAPCGRAVQTPRQEPLLHSASAAQPAPSFFCAVQVRHRLPCGAPPQKFPGAHSWWSKHAAPAAFWPTSSAVHGLTFDQVSQVRPSR
jgi:hypothetical protein